MINLNSKYKNLIDDLKNDIPFYPDIALILGSGLGDFAESVDLVKSIPTSSLPGYPSSTVKGHSGKIHFAEYSGKKLLLFQGRVHFYEGYKISECVLPAFISYRLDAKKIFITNAAGGINRNFSPGDLMLVNSLNGISIKNELTKLIGIASEKGLQNFRKFPSNEFNSIIKKAALEEKIDLKEGVYWYSKGPVYETPAEVKMIEKFGGDAVGMSTIPEAVFAAYSGLETAVVSCITNYAAGISEEKLSHTDVTKTANLVKDKFERLVKKIISLHD